MAKLNIDNYQEFSVVDFNGSVEGPPPSDVWYSTNIMYNCLTLSHVYDFENNPPQPYCWMDEQG